MNIRCDLEILGDHPDDTLTEEFVVETIDDAISHVRDVMADQYPLIPESALLQIRDGFGFIDEEITVHW